MSSELADGFQQMGSSAVTDWATASPPATGDVYVDVLLLFVQFVGLCVCVKGMTSAILFFDPRPHSKKPHSLTFPLIQIFFGMFCMVPTSVLAFVTDLLMRFGWL